MDVLATILTPSVRHHRNRVDRGMLWVALTLMVVGAGPVAAQPANLHLSEFWLPGSFGVIHGGQPAEVHVDAQAGPGVHHVSGWFRRDLEAIAGDVMAADSGAESRSSGVRRILVGTLGTGGEVDRLHAQGRLDTGGVAGQREAHVLQVLDDSTLVIAGSDKRGTIYGMLDLVRAAGVSPWTWWADVPVVPTGNLFVLPGAHKTTSPEVTYRGFFINDENPALLGWVTETFGGFNAAFYERVFELLLRLRGNYLWPAMWGKAIADDDPRSPDLADDLGVVLGTSHHEPLMRAHVEWDRYGEGPWNFAENEARLSEFWREGVLRMGDRESLVTIGMRGDGDEPMTEGTAIDLLERIVARQRAILEEVTGRPAAETPQVWALYKEVQDYYDRGMQVPEDVTLLFADDNWGNIRRLPSPDAPPRAGGYGVYYHFDYVGGPRNYKWLNTVQPARVQEQMGRAWQHGVDRIWIVNVGDIKPMELPLEFFLDMAWNPEEFKGQTADAWNLGWAQAQFGAPAAPAIADLLTRYQNLASLRTPELTGPDTYALEAHDEASEILARWRDLGEGALVVAEGLPDNARDAFFHLVEHPILAFGNLVELYVTVARNRRAAALGLAATDSLAGRAEALFRRDRTLRDRYEGAAGGKWPHMMAQTHIGYTYWQEPPEDVMPEVVRLGARGVARGPESGRSAPARTRVVPSTSPPTGFRGSVQTEGRVVVGAETFSGSTDRPESRWRVIRNLGRYGAAVTSDALRPVELDSSGAPQPLAPVTTPRLTYSVWMGEAGSYRLDVLTSPTLDYPGQGGLRYAVSVDDSPPVVLNLHAGSSERDWEQWVADGVIRSGLELDLAEGAHKIHLWLVDPGVVFQRIHIHRGEADPSFLGPPTSPISYDE